MSICSIWSVCFIKKEHESKGEKAQSRDGDSEGPGEHPHILAV